MKEILLAIVAVIFSMNSSLADILPAQKVVEEIFAKAAQETVINDQAVQTAINQRVDFVAMSRAVLGAEGKKISAQEFDWFRSTLQEIITRTVYPSAPNFLAGVQISYKSVVEKSTAAVVVKSSVQNKADITEVNYTLAKSAAGDWKVIDVSFDGESWVESIKDQVSETLKKKKWIGLRKQLNDRLQNLKEGKSRKGKSKGA